MTLIKYILAATLLVSSLSHAEEKKSDTLIEAIEVEHFVVNWSPNSDNLGRVIVYRCADCTPVTMTLSKNTELLIKGKNHPIEEISSRVDWAGVITVTNHAPTQIIKIRIY